MADISQEIAAIESAVYGEQVRGSIKNGLIKMNTELENFGTIDDHVREFYPAVDVAKSNLVSLKDSAALTPDDMSFDIPPSQKTSGEIVSISSIKYNVCGKNLLCGMRKNRANTNGITFSDNGDGGVRVVGTASQANAYSDVTVSESVLESGNYPFLPAGTYIIPNTKTNNAKFYVSVFDEDIVAVGDPKTIDSNTSAANRTITLTEPCWIYFRIQVVNGTTVDEIVYPAIYEKDVVNQDFEDFTGETYSIDIPTDPGTVYGCNVDFGNKKLYVTHKKVVMDGTTSGHRVSTKGAATVANVNYYFGLSDGYLFGKDSGWIYASELEANGFLCSGLPLLANGSEVVSEPSIGAYIGVNGTMLQPRITLPPDTTIVSVEDCNAWLAGLYSGGTPVEFTYKLATPIEYDIDLDLPTLLKGDCNIWCEGGKTEITYRADTYTRLFNMITELQAMVLENISNS